MQFDFNIAIYKQAPFVRLLWAFITGILLQWYIGFSLLSLLFGCFFICGTYAILSFFFFHTILITPALKSFLLHTIFVIMGALMVYVHLITNHASFFTKYCNSPSYATVLVLQEPLVEKSKSYKADARIIQIIQNDTIHPTTGNIIIYFKKDSISPALHYGSTLLVNKPLQPIRNNGNPGSFNYQQFSLFKGITHQLFLNKNDYSILPVHHSKPIRRFLFAIRDKVLSIIQKNIHPIKERGLAEALLIGYRDDLDKDLSQAYSNTGTVHVIAISGLHLGFIYLLLIRFFQLLEKRFASAHLKRILQWIRPLFILLILWTFSLTAGGAPSILRSAIMFSCIVLGDSFAKQSSIFNTLAISAFIILCINPFSLWDVGFQLSYAAVISIVLFMKPIYNWFYFNNQLLNWLWKLNAITLSAQILTLPITMYHFHQFPNLFLITNLVAVPLSTFILGAELLLVVLSGCTPIAQFIGNIITKLIAAMNQYIEWCSNFRFAVTDLIHISLLQTFLLYTLLLSFTYWLLHKSKKLLFSTLVLMCIYLFTHIYATIQTNAQQKIIVYNIAQHSGVDFIKGNQFQFIGDSVLQQNGFQKNFHIKPSRIFLNTTKENNRLTLPYQSIYSFANKNFLFINSHVQFEYNHSHLIPLEAVIISKNPPLYIDSLNTIFKIQTVVADATNPLWKVRLWAQDCERLRIPFHYTAEKGAFMKAL